MSVTKETAHIFSDLALSRRLERVEAVSSAEFVEARAKLYPQSAAAWIEVAGAYAMFDGVDSPLTQTFGLGMKQAVTEAEMLALENFFEERGAPVMHEISPLADASVLKLLNGRGYRPVEFTNVMFRPLQPDEEFALANNEKIKVRLAQRDEAQLWARTSALGWSEFTELQEIMLELGYISVEKEGGLAFLAELEGEAIATGVLCLYGGVALLAGASTIPAGRKQGAQRALLASRLRYAVEHDCDIAMMCALPGSASQRNAERCGFRIAYTRTKWQLPRPADRWN